MGKFKFYLNKPIISESEKLSWERGEKLPQINLSQYDIIEGTLDEIEEHIHEFIKKSFQDIKQTIDINTFEEVSIIMPSLQMCSVDEIDVIDMNIDIAEDEDEDIGSMIKKLSDGLMSDIIEDEISESVIDDVGEDIDDLDSKNPSESEISEMEMDIIKKNLLNE